MSNLHLQIQIKIYSECSEHPQIFTATVSNLDEELKRIAM